MCYYCNSGAPDQNCTEKNYGILVECQQSSMSADHYGNACAVGHTGHINF